MVRIQLARAAEPLRSSSRRWLWLAALAGALLAGACSGDDTPEPALVEAHVGILQSLSGAAGSYGTSSYRGMMLALEEIAHAEDAGVRLTISIIDDESSNEIATASTHELLAEGIVAMIGPTLSGVAFEIHPLLQDAGVVVLSPTTTASGITDAGDHVFSLALTEARVIPEVIEHAVAEHDVGRAVMFWDSEEAFSPFSSAAMREGIEAAGGSMVAEFDLSTQEIEEAVAALDGVDFDLIFVSPLLDVSAAVLDAVRAAGYEQLVIGGNSFNTPELSAQAGEAVDGTYVGAAWNPGISAEASRRFVAAYQAEYEEAPDQFSVQGYTSVHVLADAIRRAGSAEPAAIRDALAATVDLETPLGLVSFDEQRLAVHDPVIQQYQGGALRVVTP